jgi:hypothetical protein
MPRTTASFSPRRVVCLPRGGILAMTRRQHDQTFRKTDVVRALKAAQTAGIANPCIEIDMARGTIKILSGAIVGGTNHGEAIEADGSENNSNPWDEVLRDEAQPKRAT